MIESKRVESVTPEYPKLMIHENGEFIVLFNDLVSGVVVESSGREWNVGESSTTWAQQSFKLYNGVVELRNG